MMQSVQNILRMRFAHEWLAVLRLASTALFIFALQDLVKAAQANDWPQIGIRALLATLGALAFVATTQVQKIVTHLRHLAGPDATKPRSLENDLALIEQRLSQLDRTQSLAQTQLRETAAQDERNRLARDLHDTIKQQLFSINMAAATAQSLSDTNPAAALEMLQEVRNLSQQAQVEMRAMLTQLRPQPLATVGLIQALRDQLEALHFRSEVQTELVGDALPDESQLPLGAQEALFRVAQEALSNVARHARAKHATVSVTHDASCLTLTVADDGQGFDTHNTKTGMGLSNMRARIIEIGGELNMDSTIGSGTRINIRVPLVQPQPALSEDEKETRNQLVRHLSYLIAGVTACLLVPVVAVWGGFEGAIAAGAADTQRLRTVLQIILGVFGGAGILAAGALMIYARRRFRQLVMRCGNAWAGGPWQRMMRSLTIATLSGLLMLAALIALMMQQSLVAALLAMGCAMAYALTLRVEMQLSEALRDWASLRFLRTMVAENSVAYGMVAGFLVLLIGFAALSGDRLGFPPKDLADPSFAVLILAASLLLGLPLVVLYVLRLRSYQENLAGPAPDLQPPMANTQKTSLIFIFIWFALGIVNGIRGDWLGMALGFLLGTGLAVSHDADLNNWRTIRQSPRQLLGVGLALIALALLMAQIGMDVVNRVQR